MYKDIWICLENLDWMNTCRLGEYLSSIRYLRNPKFLLWGEIIKTHKGCDRYNLKKEEIWSNYQMIFTEELDPEELDVEELKEFYNENFALLSIPLSCFVFFQTVIWKKIFDEMLVIREELGVESDFVVIHDIPPLPDSLEAEFDSEQYFDYLDSWLIFHCLGGLKKTIIEDKKYYTIEINVETF